MKFTIYHHRWSVPVSRDYFNFGRNYMIDIKNFLYGIVKAVESRDHSKIFIFIKYSEDLELFRLVKPICHTLYLSHS
jgi:hypothetical protein